MSNGARSASAAGLSTVDGPRQRARLAALRTAAALHPLSAACVGLGDEVLG